jgi:hypothetical protein
LSSPLRECYPITGPAPWCSEVHIQFCQFHHFLPVVMQSVAE